MDKGTGARRHLRSNDTTWLESYRPSGWDDATWEAVQAFVVDCATRLALDGDPAGLRTIRLVARLASWALTEGLPLEVEVVLDPDVAERFVATELVDDRSWATYRSILWRIGPLLTSRAPWADRSRRTARRRVAAPYTEVELGALRSDALAQPTRLRVRAARALLALGAGAGLDGRWAAAVTAADVRVRGDVVTVRVGPPAPRVVPVLAQWQADIVDLVAASGSEFLVGGHSTHRNRAGALAGRVIVAHGHPRLSAARLRSTWLVAHLAMGTRLPELAAAAGLQSVTVLSDLLPYVPSVSGDDALVMLRGAP
ncbi:MAG: hypothetical protein ACYDH6_23700 [Acidimicrobiales bacterium]